MEETALSQRLKEQYSGYIIHFGNYDRNDTIRFKLEVNERFSEALSVRQFKKGTRELFFITLDGQNIGWCCLAEKKRRVVTDKYKVEFHDFVQLSPININGLAEELQSSIKRHFIQSISGNGGAISPKTWKALLEIIQKDNADNFKKILHLFLKRDDIFSHSDTQGINAFRKDATSFALHIGGIDTQSTTTTLTISRQNPNDDSLPDFLKGLQTSTVLLEDQILFHDCSVFDDWERLPVTPLIAQYKQGQRIVTISNFNRHPVEQQTGVDLLYYHHHFNAYALVQYKRLDPKEKVYRPIGETYKKELENMERLLGVAGINNSPYNKLLDYRMNEMFCFFKICEAKPINHHSNELIKGMYFPLDLWKLLMESDLTTGRDRGKRIGYEHVDGRYLNNTQFIELFKNGWIGSSNLSSQTITDIIQEILENKRSLILASSKTEKNQDDF